MSRIIAAVEDEIDAALDVIPAAWGADASGETGPLSKPSVPPGTRMPVYPVAAGFATCELGEASVKL